MTQEQVTEVKALTVDQLKQALEAVRADRSKSLDDVMAAANALAKAQANEAKTVAAEKAKAAQAEYDAKMAAINPITVELKNVVSKAVKATRDALVSAGVTGLQFRVTELDKDEYVLAIVPSGPGVPGSAPKAARSTSTSNGDGGKGRNVYVTTDGRQLSTRDLLTEFSAELADPSKALEPVGLSHRADNLANKLGFEKRKAE
jgi:hypothetical protein